MQKVVYQLDDELRVIEDYKGHQQVGIKRSVRAPSDALRGHVEAEKEFRDCLNDLLSEIMQEFDQQEEEIERQIAHGEFFINEFKRNQWGHNQMFDRLRLLYISQVDSLKEKRRQLRIKRYDKKLGILKELRDSKKELSPFSGLF